MLTYARVPWHVVILATVIAALLVAALPQTTDAAPSKRQRCIAAAEKALGRDIQPRNYRIVLGTDKPEEELWTRENRKDLICGFGGFEYVKGIIRPGDIFISGRGGSHVLQSWGLVIGGNGRDSVTKMYGGRFEGRANRDVVAWSLSGGDFFGGDGPDVVGRIHAGSRFLGGRGADFVGDMRGGVFRGKRGADCVEKMGGGTFHGGNGPDSVLSYRAGTLVSVESRSGAKWCPAMDHIPVV